MHNSVVYAKDFEKRSNRVYLTPFIGIRSERTMAVIEGSPGHKSSGARGAEQENSFWIAVSGYQPDRAYMVYRFFLDIGHIVDKRFTDSNLMYLKFYCMMDCEIALSYDGQKIGYGADILVRVKLENPVHEFKPETAQKAINLPAVSSAPIDEPEESPSPKSVIDNGAEKPPQEVEEPASKRVKDKKRKVPRKMSFFQWLKHKMSYII